MKTNIKFPRRQIESGIWKAPNGDLIEGFIIEDSPMFIHTMDGVYDNYNMIKVVDNYRLN